MEEKIFSEIEFEWDQYNINKSWGKHKVKFSEAEEVFLTPEFMVLPDPTHSISEKRYIALGKTRIGRLLLVVFTQRDKKIRIISARDMNKKERRYYDEKIKRSP